MIEVAHGDERTTAIVVIEMKQASTTQLSQLLRAAVRWGDVGVVIDLGERADASSELLTVLHRAARQLRGLGARLAVVSPKPELRRLFDVTLLSQGFGVYRTRDEALRSWA